MVCLGVTRYPTAERGTNTDPSAQAAARRPRPPRPHTSMQKCDSGAGIFISYKQVRLDTITAYFAAPATA